MKRRIFVGRIRAKKTPRIGRIKAKVSNSGSKSETEGKT